MSGCHLRCQYCHNIDVTIPKGGTLYKPKDLIKKIAKNKGYYDASGGGVTFSGGDPFFQPRFLAACLKEAQVQGIHTCVDTSLYTSQKHLDAVIPHTDLFMVSVKHLDNEAHKALTQVSNVPIQKNLHYLAAQGVGLWIRFVLLPGHTDTPEHLAKFVALLHELKPEKVELLPYHIFGRPKWKELGWKYELANVEPPTLEQCHMVQKQLEAEGFEVSLNE